MAYPEIAMNMFEILTAAEMQACDRATTEHFGRPSFDLMRAAGRAVADFARAQFPGARRVTVFCGRGNNGGDGMVAARLLADAGLEVTTLLLGAPEKLAGDAGQAWRELAESMRAPVRAAVHVLTDAEELERHNDALGADLMIDALLGTGFKPPLKGLALAAHPVGAGKPRAGSGCRSAFRMAGGCHQRNAGGPGLSADAVVTFTAPKPAHVFGQLTRHWDQPVVVAPIGSPR